METIESIKTRTPIVFVANQSSHNYDAAKKFGAVQYISKGYVNFESPNLVKTKIAEAVAYSNSDDYLILTGINLMCVYVALIWYAKHRRINILHWVQPSKDLDGEYQVHVVDKIHELLSALGHLDAS